MTELLAGPGAPGRPWPFAVGLERARLGRALHARWQEAQQERAAAAGDAQDEAASQAGAPQEGAPDDAAPQGAERYRAELSLRTALRQDDWEVVLHGRADGVREGGPGEGAEDGLATVEELKSLLAWPPGEELAARARRQAALYAWMLAHEERRPVAAEVVWLVPDAPARREPVPTPRETPEVVEAELRRDLALVLRAVEADAAARKRRRAWAATLPFPFPRPRPMQRALAEEVSRALAEGERLLLEAPTGAGKTAAVLHAALRGALAAERRVVVLTPTALVGRTWSATLARLAPPADAAEPRGVRLRGKAALCLQPRPVCHPALCGAARAPEPETEAPALLARAFAGDGVLEPERAHALGAEATLCPFELARRAAAVAPVWIADWNHAFHPRAALPELAGEAAEGDVWILDEVHRLPDRLRAAGAATLAAEDLERAARALALRGAPRHARQRELLEAVAEVVEDAAAEAGLDPAAAAATGGEPPAVELEQPVPVEALEALREPLARAVGEELAAEAGFLPEPESPFVDAAAAVEDLLEAAARPGAEGLVGRLRNAAVLRVVLPDPAALAREALARPHAVIGLSATLPPTDFLADALGLDRARVAERRLAPAPDPARLRVVIDPGVQTGFRARARATDGVARRLAALTEAVPGHTLAVLPGFAWLEQVHTALRALPGGRAIVAQPRESGEAARRTLLDALASARPTLLLAVAGGVLVEGIDVAPGRLGAVAVVGPCLPPPDAERRLLERVCGERFGEDAAFLHAYAVPGLGRVVQAAGRLLRSETDRGVIALLGRRFLEPPYRDLLPAAWLGGTSPDELVGDPAEAARHFFATSAPPADPQPPAA